MFDTPQFFFSSCMDYSQRTLRLGLGLPRTNLGNDLDALDSTLKHQDLGLKLDLLMTVFHLCVDMQVLQQSEYITCQSLC